MQLWLPFLVSFSYLIASLLLYRVYLGKFSSLIATAVLVFAVQGHAFVLIKSLTVGNAFDLSVFKVISIYSWSVSAAIVFVAWRRSEALAVAVIAFMSAIFVLIPYASGVSKPFLKSDMALGFIWHILSSIAAWTVLSIAFVHAGIYIYLFQQLKAKKRLTYHPTALAGLERVILILGAIGLLLLLISLVTGWFFVEDLFDQHLLFKTIFTLLSWLFLLRLFLGWLINRQGGIKLVFILMTSYALLLLGYVINNVILQFLKT